MTSGPSALSGRCRASMSTATDQGTTRPPITSAVFSQPSYA